MRPRKRILIYGGDELTVSVLRVVLESKGRYHVETEMSYPAPDAFLLVGFSQPEIDAFEAQRWQACPFSPAVMVPKRDWPVPSVWMASLLEKLYRATCKRGPKQAVQGLTKREGIAA